MNEKNNSNAKVLQTTLSLASARLLPMVVRGFRNKLIGVVLAGLVLPQVAYAGHGGGGGGHSGGHHSGGSSAGRSMPRLSGGNFQRSNNSFKASNNFKSSNNFKATNNFKSNGNKSANTTGALKTRQPGDFKKLSNSTAGANASTKSHNTASANSWKKFRDNKIAGTGGAGTGTGIGGMGTGGMGAGGMGTGGAGTGTAGTGTGGMGTGGGMGQGNGMGGGHGHGRGFPWWLVPQVAGGLGGYGGFGGGGFGGGYGGGYGGGCQTDGYQQADYVDQQPVYAEQQAAYADAPAPASNPLPSYNPLPTYNPAPAFNPAPAQPTQVQPVSTDGYVDLVLEDVEFLEPATVTVGPLYLVKVRNQGTALASKFRIGAFAQLEGELSDDAPRAVTEVSNLGAGETASVTLRLPATAMKLISTSSAATNVFNQLLVVVDLDDAVVETEKSNNVANLDRAALETAAATH